MGIIPTGTRNNIALSLGIPLKSRTPSPFCAPAAASGSISACSPGRLQTSFLELCSAGLSSRFPGGRRHSARPLEKKSATL
jgi:diacylglycerol kinase family enzyme